MLSFKNFVDEEVRVAENDKSHYTHIEDELYVKGIPGIEKVLRSLVDLLKGIPTTTVQTKIDGSPSVFFGRDASGEFFVATKSIFNASPKINKTPAEIDKNHGHAPGLASKLKLALKYLPEIYDASEILQADVMFAPEDVHVKEIDGSKYYTFRPNTVTNAVAVTSQLGKEIRRAKFGIAVHTKYDSNGTRMPVTKSDTKPSASVFQMPVNAPKISDYTKLQGSVNELRSTLEGSSREGLRFVSSPVISPLILQYVNSTVRDEKKQTYEGFVSFIKTKFQKEIDNLKREETKTAKAQELHTLLNSLETNRDGLTNVINCHEKVSLLKDAIIHELDRNQPIRRFFEGEDGSLQSTGPEGYVGLHPRLGTSKFVNRGVFSKQNFLINAKRKIAVTEAMAASRTAVVVPLGRFNPPHKDHMQLILALIKMSRKVNGTAIVYVSRSQDGAKNPLSATEKIYFLKKMFVGLPVVFKTPPEAMPSMIGAFKELDGKFDKVYVVLGDDTLALSRALMKYNGTEYHFKELKMLSRHSITNMRSADGDGVHASEVRAWARAGDFDKMRSAMPDTLSDDDVVKMMTLIQKRTKK